MNGFVHLLFTIYHLPAILLTDERGESRISAEDYAVALLDEIEIPGHLRQRMTVAY